MMREEGNAGATACDHCLWPNLPGQVFSRQDSLPDHGTHDRRSLLLFALWLFFRKSVPDTHWKHFPMAVGKQGSARARAWLWSSLVTQETTFHVHLERRWHLATKAIFINIGSSCWNLSRFFLSHTEQKPMFSAWPTWLACSGPYLLLISLSLAMLPQLLYIFRWFLKLVKVISTLRPCMYLPGKPFP